MAGAAGPVIDLANLGSHPGLAHEFDSGQEIIQEGSPGAAAIGESLEFGGGVETAAAGILPDAREVFLFDETVVVFLVGPGAGKGDAAGITPGQEGRVDTLRAVVAVDAPEGKGKAGLDVREGVENPWVGFIEEGAEFRPA
ncbi:MAG: hypothetical protein LBP88_08480 [Treponema sp.]|nr:hypothetical protein [Treponema sp.]